MAVYEHSYKPYDGPLTSERSRLLVLPRYAYRMLFANKGFLTLFILCFVCPLIYSILIYLQHNNQALAIFGIAAGSIQFVNRDFFYVFVSIQISLAFILTVIIGPGLISRDLSNNAIPLYLSRPFSKVEYVLGKMSVLLILLSLITWIPGELLFFFQSYLAGGGWMKDNFFIASAMFQLFILYIGLLSILAMAFSALFKWKTVASAALFAVMIITAPIGGVIWEMFDTNQGMMLSIPFAFTSLAIHLFDLQWMKGEQNLTVWQSVTTFIVYAAVGLFLLSRKIRAYEVVS